MHFVQSQKKYLLSICLLLAVILLLVGSFFSYFFINNIEFLSSYGKINLKDYTTVSSDQSYINKQMNLLALKVAKAKSRIVYLEELGKSIAEKNHLDIKEFTFISDPVKLDFAMNVSQLSDLNKSINELFSEAGSQYQQLKSINYLLNMEKRNDNTVISGKPLRKGWMTSPFGYRTDPITKKKRWHNGVDYSYIDSTDVLALGAGVVTWAGSWYGYGNMLEINHGNGYVTRYGHNASMFVKRGDIVKKNQAIATMGSTGRTSGLNVHLEVLLNGQALDPETVINKNK